MEMTTGFLVWMVAVTATLLIQQYRACRANVRQELHRLTVSNLHKKVNRVENKADAAAAVADCASKQVDEMEHRVGLLAGFYTVPMQEHRNGKQAEGQ